jgi:hypothetical protein
MLVVFSYYMIYSLQTLVSVCLSNIHPNTVCATQMSIQNVLCVMRSQNPERINALKGIVTSYDSISFDPKDPVLVSKT